MKIRGNQSNPRDIVVITGGSGLIGQNLAKHFTKDYQVVALDIKQPKSPIEHMAFIEMNISEEESIEKALNQLKEEFGTNIASVIHLAAFYSFDVENSHLYQKITVEGTEKLLNSLQNFKVDQFIFSSTMLVHAPGVKGQSIDETWPVNPQWSYPQSKVAAENIIESTHGEIPYVLFRIAGVYDDRCHSIPIANQIERINEHHFASHLYPGRTTHGQSFIHMEDLISAFSQAVKLRKTLPSGLTLILGEPKALSYQEMQDAIGQLIHGRDWFTQTIPVVVAISGAWLQEKIPFIQKPFIKSWMVKLADHHYELDISRAQKFLNWTPAHNLKDTLPEMIHFLKTEPEKFYAENKITKPIPAAVGLRKYFPALVSLGAIGFFAQALMRRKAWR